MSARLDAELSATGSRAVDEHLTGCAVCRTWQARAVEVTRLVRTRPAETGPDLSGLADRLLGRPALAVVGAACGCASSCGCGCQQGHACQCSSRAA